MIGSVAQSVEQQTENLRVGSSILPRATILEMPVQLSWPEQLICNQQAGGSNPFTGSIFCSAYLFQIYQRQTRFLCGEVGERSNPGDCKSPAYGFEGSNPSLTTIFMMREQLSWLEHQPSKLRVAGSSPVSRSIMSLGAELQRCNTSLLQ